MEISVSVRGGEEFEPPSRRKIIHLPINVAGCDVSRLQEFVTGFYAQNSAYPSQTVDETYCAFLWSVIVRYPTVLVGTTPPGAATEVYIAPQLSAKRKVVKGESEADGKAQDAVSTLDIIEDARSRSLEELRREYGDTLRIAVDPKTSFAAITGSHIRVRDLTIESKAIVLKCHATSPPS